MANLPPKWCYDVVDLGEGDGDTAWPAEDNCVQVELKDGVVWNVRNLPPGYGYEESHLPYEKVIYKVEGYDMREYKVSLAGRQGHVSVPKSWAGKKIKAILTEQAE